MPDGFEVYDGVDGHDGPDPGVPTPAGVWPRCRYCGAELPPGSGVRIELTRPAVPGGPPVPDVDAGEPDPEQALDHAGPPDVAVLTFCSERHAARWLGGELAPTGGLPLKREPLRGADRLTAAALLLALAVLVGLTIAGAWTVWNWIF